MHSSGALLLDPINHLIEGVSPVHHHNNVDNTGALHCDIGPLEYTCVNSGAHAHTHTHTYTHTHTLNNYTDASLLLTDTEETMNCEPAAPVGGDDDDDCADHGEGGGGGGEEIAIDSPAATNAVCHLFME